MRALTLEIRDRRWRSTASISQTARHHERANGCCALRGRAGGSIDFEVVCSLVCRMVKLLSRHADASIFARLFPRLKDRKWSPDAHDIDLSRRENLQTGVELCGVS